MTQAIEQLGARSGPRSPLASAHGLSVDGECKSLIGMVIGRPWSGGRFLMGGGPPFGRIGSYRRTVLSTESTHEQNSGCP